MDDEHLSKKLNSGEYTLCSAEKFKLTSPVYNSFMQLCDNKKEIYQGYVRCSVPECQQFIKHDVHKSGTSHLKIHAASVNTHELNFTGNSSKAKNNNSQQKITNFMPCSKTISDKDKLEVRSSLSYFCAADIRPFSAVECIGFQKAPKCSYILVINMATYPLRTLYHQELSIAETCLKDAEQDHQAFVDTINVFIAHHGVIGVTTDMWQDDYKKKNFVAVTVHMTPEGRMITSLLQVY